MLTDIETCSTVKEELAKCQLSHSGLSEEVEAAIGRRRSGLLTEQQVAESPGSPALGGRENKKLKEGVLNSVPAPL